MRSVRTALMKKNIGVFVLRLLKLKIIFGKALRHLRIFHDLLEQNQVLKNLDVPISIIAC